MSRPRLLDLFCGAGGAAVGYAQAGFKVVGVDINPQPRYPFELHVSDAMAFPFDGFDVIHASPLCHRWSKMRNCRPGSNTTAPDLITPLRPRLQAAGVPYVIENVPGAPLHGYVQVCGSGLGMTLQRHRWFESNIALWGVPCAHGQNPWNPAYKQSTGRRHRRVPVIGEWRTPRALQHQAMGIHWMTLPELTQAIPPTYTQWIGEQLLTAAYEWGDR